MSEKNCWYATVEHRGCIFPCHGHPVLNHKTRKVQCAADSMPAFLSCSECGYTPLPEIQPVLVARFLEHFNRNRGLPRKGNGTRGTRDNPRDNPAVEACRLLIEAEGAMIGTEFGNLLLAKALKAAKRGVQ